MRFIHIADVHLGARPDAGSAYSEKREREVWNSLARLVEVCNEKRADLLLIAGDLFHRQPLLRELKEVNYLFGTLVDTQVLLIAGNHDYLKKDSFYRTFEWASNVHMILSSKVTSVKIPELSLAVYGLSYHAREICEERYDGAAPDGTCQYEILLAHGGDEKHIPFRRKKLLSLGYDYVALGHIHKPCDMELGKVPGTGSLDTAGIEGGGCGFEAWHRSRMAYSGALEPVDKNDTGLHGYIEGELTKKGCRIRFVPCASREYVHMEVPVEKQMTGHELKKRIRTMIEDRGTQNIYRIILRGFRDPDVLFDLTDMDSWGNITDLTDCTKPAYDFARLLKQNRQDILGRYIESLIGYEEDSVEYLALCEGVQALMETKVTR
jgi:predicted phosphodiesterase